MPGITWTRATSSFPSATVTYVEKAIPAVLSSLTLKLHCHNTLSDVMGWHNTTCKNVAEFPYTSM